MPDQREDVVILYIYSFILLLKPNFTSAYACNGVIQVECRAAMRQ